MNNALFKERQLVPFDNGAKAMLIFKPHRKTAVIEFYVPSKKYLQYIEVYKERIAKLEAPKKYPRRVPVSSLGYHTYNANKLFQALITAGYLDPKLDDIVFDIDFDLPVKDLLPPEVYKQHELLNKNVQWESAELE